MAITRSQSNKSRRKSSTRVFVLPLLRRRATPLFVDLPGALLTAVAEFLPQTSVALFAVAFSDADNSETSNAIISSFEASSSEKEPWAVMDFLDIEKSLRIKLTDENLADVLKIINAVEEVKTLKLTHLYQITGVGLEPLLGSVVLEQLDLTQVGQHDFPYSNKGRISDKTVLPILDSIIDKEGSALRHLQFPQKWLGVNHAFQLFLDKYDGFLRQQEICCSSCEEICQDNMLCKTEGLNRGLQLLTCYECQETQCYECQEYSGLDVCTQCKKNYCGDCVSVSSCDTCANQSCFECGLVNYCDCCDSYYCDFCGH